jgi:hypothetical protein
MPGNSKQVTLPAATQNMSQQALDHIPVDHFVFDPTVVDHSPAASNPIDHVPEQAAPHVPTDVPPPVSLPDAAIGHMSDVAQDQLAAHTDWFI